MKSLTNHHLLLLLPLLLAIYLTPQVHSLPTTTTPLASHRLPFLPLPLLTPRQAASLNALLALITQLFPINFVLTDASTLLVDAGQALATAAGEQTTREDLTSGTCGDVLVVFARGTDEPGNVGALVGPPLFDALGSALGSGKTVAVQGVDNYPASIAEYLEGGSPEGSAAMAASVTQAVSQCPNSAIVMSGYSQGAQVVHKAASQLGSTMSSVKAVVTFGDPDSSTAVAGIAASKTLVVCHTGDDICQFGDVITLEHLNYAENTPQAAAFIVSQI